MHKSPTKHTGELTYFSPSQTGPKMSCSDVNLETHSPPSWIRPPTRRMDQLKLEKKIDLFAITESHHLLESNSMNQLSKSSFSVGVSSPTFSPSARDCYLWSVRSLKIALALVRSQQLVAKICKKLSRFIQNSTSPKSFLSNDLLRRHRIHLLGNPTPFVVLYIAIFFFLNEISSMNLQRSSQFLLLEM